MSSEGRIHTGILSGENALKASAHAKSVDCQFIFFSTQVPCFCCCGCDGDSLLVAASFLEGARLEARAVYWSVSGAWGRGEVLAGGAGEWRQPNDEGLGLHGAAANCGVECRCRPDPASGGLRRFQTVEHYEPALGMANVLSRYPNVTAPEIFLINTSAQAASVYSAIKRGGTLPYVYDRLIQYVTEAKRLSLLSSVLYSVAAVCVCHGETDMSVNAIGALTEDQLRLAYFSSLQEWRTDFSNDFSTLEVPVEGGQGVRMLLYQMSTWRRSTVAGTQNQNGNAGVTLAQLDAHEAGTHVVVAPTYAFEHLDHFHLTRTDTSSLARCSRPHCLPNRISPVAGGHCVRWP